MALIALDLTGALALTHNYEFRIALHFPGNVLGTSLKGQIWTAYNGEPLAGFRVGNPVYKRDGNYTEIELFLTKQQILGLPLTSTRLWIYNVAMFRVGKPPKLLLEGSVQVSPAFPL